MKRGLILLGAVLISLLTISSVTAHPYSQSQPVMDIISELEALEEMVSQAEEQTIQLPKTFGIIDIIKQLLSLILNLILSLIQFVLGLMDIVELIESIINAINQLIQIVMDFINMIIDLFSPSNHATF